MVKIDGVALFNHEQQILADPAYAIEHDRLRRSHSEEQDIPCPPPDDTYEPQTPRNSKTEKLQDLMEPIKGIYIGKEDGKFSPIYIFETEEGIRRLFGCKDLDLKMKQLNFYDEVYISFAGLHITSYGHQVFKAAVKILT